MQIFGTAEAGEQKTWLGWCLDMTLPSLSLPSNSQLVEEAHPSQHSQGDRDGDLGSSGKEAEGADNLCWSGQRDRSSLAHLVKASTTVGSRWWQTSSWARRQSKTRGVSRKSPVSVRRWTYQCKRQRIPKLAPSHLQHSSTEQLSPTGLLQSCSTPKQCCESVLKQYQ